MIVSTAIGLLALVIGLIIGWPVLVTLSAIFVAVQLLMIGARATVERNDRRLAARLAARLEAHNGEA